ncbi:MAG: hypothetical protein HFI33_05030 [Lachnospiraceae bacterium]|nr:hypothetical protein [Lachnospiraceae bacterium]
MRKVWNVTVNGTEHKIEYKTGWGSKLLVDGATYKLKSQNPFIVLIDCPIVIDGAEIRIVAIGNKVDLAVNGVYQSNQEKYIPVRNVPGLGQCTVGLKLCGWLAPLWCSGNSFGNFVWLPVH